MSTALLDKLTTTDQGEPVTAPAAGIVHRLIATAGETVTPLATVATVQTSDGLVSIRAGARGVVALLVTEGQHVTPGEVVATVAPVAPVEAPSAPVANGTANGTNGAQRPTARRHGRRNGHVAPLVIEELTPEPEPATLYQKDEPRRARIVKMMTRPTDEQRDALGELADVLGVPRAELERLAFARLLAMSRADVVRALNEQRKDEQRGRYGYGARAW